MMATEKVTRKTLNDADQRRLVEEALGELDSLRPVLGRSAEQLMDELAQVYARSLFEVALEQGKLDELREQLGAVRGRTQQNHELAVFFFSPYFSTTEKQDGARWHARRGGPGAGELPHLLIENHRMPVIFRVRQRVRAAVG